MMQVSISMNFVFDTMTILLTRYDRFTNDIGCAVSVSTFTFDQVDVSGISATDIQRRGLAMKRNRVFLRTIDIRKTR